MAKQPQETTPQPDKPSQPLERAAPPPPLQPPTENTPSPPPPIQPPTENTPSPPPPVQETTGDAPPPPPPVQIPTGNAPPPPPPVQMPTENTPSPPSIEPGISSAKPSVTELGQAPIKPKPTSPPGTPLDKLDMLLQNLKAKQEPVPPQSGPPSPPSLIKPPLPRNGKPSVLPPPPPISAGNVEPQPQPKAAETPSIQDTQKMVTELKIKVADVNKSILDIEMQNIMGELPDADFEAKTARLQSVKERLEQQIKDLQ